MYIKDTNLDVDDDGKLHQKYLNKKINARYEGIDFNLTYDEFAQLVRDANLISSNLGYTRDNYVLARYGDSGGYEVGNCRFITQLENAHERKLTSKMIENSKKSARAMSEHNKRDPDFGRKISEGLAKSDRYQQLKQIKHESYLRYRANLDPRKSGKNNSQYGTFWITNGTTNKKWKHELGDLPEGFRRGRVMNKGL